MHESGHCQGLLDGCCKDEHGDVTVETEARGEEMHDVAWQQLGWGTRGTHSQLHAERSGALSVTFL